jgi:hypothetical protein
MNNGGLSALLAGIKNWAYPVMIVAGLIFWTGVSYSELADLKARIERMEAKIDKIDQVIREIKK